MSNKAQVVPKGPAGTFGEVPSAGPKTGSSQPIVSQVTTGEAVKIVPPTAGPLPEKRHG